MYSPTRTLGMVNYYDSDKYQLAIQKIEFIEPLNFGFSFKFLN